MPGPASPAGAIWQVRWHGEIHGQQTRNIMHFQTPGAVDDMDLRLIVVLANCFLTHLKPVLSSDFTMKEIRYQLVSANPPGTEWVHPIVGGVGGGNTAALPSFCSAVITILGAIGGRSGKGRISFAGVPEDQTIDSTIDPASPLWTALIAFCACVAAAFINEGTPPTNFVRLIIYSRVLGGDEFPFSIAGATHALALEPRAQVGTINSRKVGRGS